MKLLPFVFFSLLLFPTAFANTGWWQFAYENDEIRVLVAPSKFSLIAGEPVHFVVSIINASAMKQNESFFLAESEVSAQVRAGHDALISNRTLHSTDGHIEFDYTFPREGFYELVFVTNYRNSTYTTEFPVGVRAVPRQHLWIYGLIGSAAVVGFIIGWLFRGPTKS